MTTANRGARFMRARWPLRTRNNLTASSTGTTRLKQIDIRLSRASSESGWHSLIGSVPTICRPLSDAARVVEAWFGWAGRAPDEIATSLDRLATGNLDEPASVEVFGSMLANRSDTVDAPGASWREPATPPRPW